MEKLLSEYKEKKKHIKKRLKEFRDLYDRKDEDIFAELCFCLLTPQSKAVSCDKAIKNLKKRGLLLNGSKSVMKNQLKGVRFPNNKTLYLIAARKLFRNNKAFDIKSRFNNSDVFKTREWLVKNVKGLGYKEASHFLRNIGLGKDIAILDVHILRNLKKYRVIKKIPSSLSRRSYLDIENRMRAFSERINVPLEDLDLLFWSNQTGFIFK
ncbi:MAG: N-glycosylase/DNA lyase [Candidatus Omnitrophica bacterium]|nr:N-glycosylase/DNA lyase [Candidatus Omnitrophota bacterium]